MYQGISKLTAQNLNAEELQRWIDDLEAEMNHIRAIASSPHPERVLEAIQKQACCGG